MSTKDELGDDILELSDSEYQAAVYLRIDEYFDRRLAKLRLQGDKLEETELDGRIRKGRIAEIKMFKRRSKAKSPTPTKQTLNRTSY